MEEVHEDKEEQKEEDLGSIADGDDIPESEEEITQGEEPIDPGEAIEIDDTEEGS